jgi:dipeptidase E
VKLLLTSGGIRNASLLDALVQLLGKPIAECSALLIPTALYGHPQGTPAGAWRFVNGCSGCPMGELGWKSLGLLELTALPSIGAERWVPWVQAADALLVEGGDAVYLSHWMRQSGLVEVLPSLQRTVWVGLSAGSMVMTPRVGDEFVEMRPSITGSDATLGIVPFSIFPHLDHPGFDGNTMTCAERWAARIGGPAYAIDDQTGIQVVGSRTAVVSEGQWRYFGSEVAP